MAKLIEVLKAVKDAKLGLEKPPYDANCVFGTSFSIDTDGEMVNLGGADSDYVSLAQARRTLDWLVDQLGGKIKWEK